MHGSQALHSPTGQIPAVLLCALTGASAVRIGSGWCTWVLRIKHGSPVSGPCVFFKELFSVASSFLMFVLFNFWFLVFCICMQTVLVDIGRRSVC